MSEGTPARRPGRFHSSFHPLQTTILRPRLAIWTGGVIAMLLFLDRPALAQSAPPRFPEPGFAAVTPGVDYAHLQTTNQPWSIHVARLDRRHRGFEIITTLSQGTIAGLSTLSTQVVSVSSALGRPIAAVNGDFFVLKPGPYQGDPAGLQIVQGELVSAATGQSFWVAPGGAIRMDSVHPRFHVLWPDGQRTPMGLNEEPKPDRATLFTPAFGNSTKATNSAELVLEKLAHHSWLPLRANQTYHARVREIRETGDTPLRPDIAVLAVNGKAARNLTNLKPGATLRLALGLSRNLGNVNTALGGGVPLVRDGKEQGWPVGTGAGSAPLPRHPRTALGFNRRYFFLVCVDGRQRELSIGMDYPELAALMKHLGCTEAMNLDGGGSTTFWLDGKVRNSPSDHRERGLANAVMIVQTPE